jgi:hypothetical protein
MRTKSGPYSVGNNSAPAHKVAHRLTVKQRHEEKDLQLQCDCAESSTPSPAIGLVALRELI